MYFHNTVQGVADLMSASIVNNRLLKTEMNIVPEHNQP